MKPIVRKILYILAILALAGVSILLFTSARKVSSSTVSTGEVIVKFTDGESFLSEEQIKEYIESEYGIIAGKIADSINLAKIEDILNSKSMIQNSEVYITKKGDLNVIVSQRKPSVRFQKGSEVIFADKEGKLFSAMIDRQLVKKQDSTAEMNEAIAWFSSLGAGENAEITEGIDRLRHYLVESMPFRFSGNSLQDYIFAELSVLCAKFVAAVMGADSCQDGRNLMICDDSASVVDAKAAAAAGFCCSLLGRR